MNDRDDFDPEEIKRFMQQFLSGNSNFNPEELAKAAGLPLDPQELSKLFAGIQQSMFSGKEGIDWDLARKQAVGQLDSTDTSQRPEANLFDSSFATANLWVDQATIFSNGESPAVAISQENWISGSLDVFSAISDPIALSMSNALSDNLGQMLPPELTAVMGEAGGMLRRAGSVMFAMQIGQAMGQLAQEALGSTDLTIPTISQPSLVAINVKKFAADLQIDISEITLYLAVREIAIYRLFHQSGWLRDRIVNQIREFAAGITIDTESMTRMAEDLDLENPEELNEKLRSGSFISPRTPDQELALERIETNLALIEGWYELVTAEATQRLPKASAISEAIRRRRAVGGPAEKTFETLLGLELRPKLTREATEMWQAIEKEFGQTVRDELWLHPDSIPSLEEIKDPKLVIARLKDDTDDIDQALRDLLS